MSTAPFSPDTESSLMARCLQLARLGAGHTGSNPLVGAVLVHGSRIIGEGYHQVYGGPHAEVNCIDAVKEEDRPLICEATLYVSLEPCAHFGKTPPCADLIIRHRIPRVVIGSQDPFAAVNGKGIGQLKAAGIDVKTGLLEKECLELNRRFFTFHTKRRPYIILKWAQTADGYIGNKVTTGKKPHRLRISNEFTDRRVHKWRSEEKAILVGAGTALHDNPALTNRLWTGPSPVRLVIDRQLRLPGSLRLFDRSQPTIIFNTRQDEETPNLRWFRIDPGQDTLTQVMTALYQLQLQSVLVEGGAELLQSFIDEGLWDEARIIQAPAGKPADMEGVKAPWLDKAIIHDTVELQGDRIITYRPAAND